MEIAVTNAKVANEWKQYVNHIPPTANRIKQKPDFSKVLSVNLSNIKREGKRHIHNYHE